MPSVCAAINSSANCSVDCIWVQDTCEPTCSSYKASPQCPSSCISGVETCKACQDGHIPDRHQQNCEACPSGTYAKAGYEFRRTGACNTAHLGALDDNTSKSQGFMGITLEECLQQCADYDDCKYFAFSETFSQDGSLACFLYPFCPGPSQNHALHVWSLYEMQAFGSSCAVCDAGWVPNARQNTCSPCENGAIAIPGSTVCTLCTNGSVPTESRSSCRLCEPGTYATEGSMQCQTCPAGAVPNEAQSDCVSCGVDSYARLGDKTCVQCDVGFVPNARRTGCKRCSHDQIVRGGTCEYCPTGHVPSAELAQIACEPCKGGTYAVAGSAVCTSCPFGATSSRGSDSCSIFWPIILLGVLILCSLVGSIGLAWYAWKTRKRKTARDAEGLFTSSSSDVVVVAVTSSVGAVPSSVVAMPSSDDNQSPALASDLFLLAKIDQEAAECSADFDIPIGNGEDVEFEEAECLGLQPHPTTYKVSEDAAEEPPFSPFSSHFRFAVPLSTPRLTPRKY